MSAAPLDVLWITAGLGCDGDSVAITAATNPSIEDLVDGVLPGVPPIRLHNPLLAFENGADFLKTFERAAAGALGPFILVVEGSVPNETLAGEGCWAGLGVDADGQPIPTVRWIDRLAARAWAVIAIGTCATNGGIHAMWGNPTGAMGLSDYLGAAYRSQADLPIVNLPGCPVQPDNFTELLYGLLRQYAGRDGADGPTVDLDELGRPRWLFNRTVHESCDRGGYYEEANFAADVGGPECIVKQGCWGPVVECNVGKRGWIGGVGGCASVGGVCIGCTMPGFPDRFMPFNDEPPGAIMSTAAVSTYGTTVRALRRFTLGSLRHEPAWRATGPRLTTGFDPATGEVAAQDDLRRAGIRALLDDLDEDTL